MSAVLIATAAPCSSEVCRDRQFCKCRWFTRFGRQHKRNVQVFYDAAVAVGVVLALAAAMMLLREVSSGVVFLVRAGFCEMSSNACCKAAFAALQPGLCIVTYHAAFCHLDVIASASSAEHCKSNRSKRSADAKRRQECAANCTADVLMW